MTQLQDFFLLWVSVEGVAVIFINYYIQECHGLSYFFTIGSCAELYSKHPRPLMTKYLNKTFDGKNKFWGYHMKFSLAKLGECLRNHQ